MSIKIQSVWDFGIGIEDIMCDDITCEDLHLPSVTGMYDITCEYQTFDDLNPECVSLWYWDWRYNLGWYNMWISTSSDRGKDW